ncbi:MAG: zinc ribbon domain-containing protein [Candidatus Omnitrophota bacterium]
MFYQYYCEQNGRTVEVEHGASRRFKTWGEVCKRAGIACGDVSPGAPVTRLISRPQPAIWRLKGLDKDAPSDKLEF